MRRGSVVSVAVVTAVLLVLGASPAGAGPLSTIQAVAVPAVAGQTGAINGRLTDIHGGPAAGVCVSANRSGQSPVSTATAADGSYSLTVAPATYTIEFFPGCGGANYAIQWYLDTLSYNGATPITVAPGGTASSVDAVLSPGGMITGVVTDTTGKPIPGTCVFAYLQLPAGQNITFNDEMTGADGSYSLRGMAAGSYTVEFVPSCDQGAALAVQWYPGVASQDRAQWLAVAPGQTLTGIGARLAVGGQISGRVVDSQGKPLAGICVNPSERNASGESVTYVEATTDYLGRYTVNDLPAGNVILQFFSGCGGGDYVATWYPEQPTVNTATPIALVAGQVLSVPDETMALGGAVAGMVSDTQYRPVDGICVEATSTTTSGPAAGYYASTLTDGSGTYHLGGLPTASYVVDFRSGCSGGSFQEQWYPDASSVSGAKPVAVTAGLTTGVINAHLAPTSAGPTTTTPAGPTPAGAGILGYWEAGSDGSVYAWGDAKFHGSASGHPLSNPVVGMAATPDGGGYWLVASDGGIFPFGDATFHGSTGAVHLNQPIVGMAATPDGGGYWLVASDGGIFSFGDASFHGSTGAIRLNRPIVGMASTPDGNGYWLVASDGGIFSFGDASFHGSTGAMHLAAPIIGMAPTPDGAGYWLAAADGGIFTFGDAAFLGSAAGKVGAGSIAGVGKAPDGGGYWMAATNGGIFGFGDAGFDGSADAYGPNVHVVGLATTR